jgi:hypothetical protein
LHAAAPVVLPQKSIFNLRVYAMEPLLRTLGSFLISGNLRFQLRNPIFGCAQLMRELLRRLQSVSTVLFRNAGRFVQQLQDRLARFVELIGIARCGAFGSAREWNDIRHAVVTTNLTMHHSALPLDVSNHIVGGVFDCGVQRLKHEFHCSSGVFVWSCCG